MEVKPLQALFIVLLFGGLAGLGIWGSVESTGIQGASDLRFDRQGQLHVRIHDKIFVYDTYSDLVNEYALEDLAIEGLFGSYSFYTDHSILLSPARIQPGFDDLDAASYLGNLLRCSLESGDCRRLEKSGHSFRQTFRAYVDESDDIFLADTVTGKVYWLDEEGGTREQLPRVLDRPSQVQRYDDVLVISHTEGQELLLVPLQDGHFADEGQWLRIATTSPENRSRRETRPIDFARIDVDWYVLAKKLDMRSGAIYRYDPAGQLLSHFTLLPGTDPFAIADFDGTLVVADYAKMTVQRYSTGGQHLGYLSSSAQDEYVAALQQRKFRFATLGYAGWGLFTLALIAGFVIGIRAQLTHAKSQVAHQPGAASPPPKATGRPHHLDPGIHWLTPSKTPLRLGILTLFLTLLIPVALGFVFVQGDDAGSACIQASLQLAIWGLVVICLAVTGLVAFVLRKVSRTRVGVINEWVIVDHSNGTVRTARDEDLLRLHNGFIINDTTIPTGTPQLYLYDKKELEQWLKPRLERATALGPWQQTVWQWHNKRGVFIASVLAIIVLLALVLAAEGGWTKDWSSQWLQSRPECQTERHSGETPLN